MFLQNLKRRFTSSGLPHPTPFLDEKSQPVSEQKVRLVPTKFIVFVRQLSRDRLFQEPVPPKTATQVCYNYLVYAFNCPDVTITSLQNRQPPLRDFIESTVRSSEASDSYVAGSIVILDRLREQLPHSLHGLMFSGHLLFFSAFMIVMQQDCKDGVRAFTDEFWCGVSGYNMRDVRRFKQWMYKKLDGNVSVLVQDEPVLESLCWSFERLPLPVGVHIPPTTSDPVPQAHVSSADAH
jgi:hypothetical protein